MRNRTKGSIIRVFATLLSVGAPLGATLSVFPLWVAKSSEATVSGIAVLFCGLSMIPFLKQIKEYMKSPSAWVVWGIIFAGCFALRAIIDQMIFISAIGLASNVAGTGLYKVGDYVKTRADKDGYVYVIPQVEQAPTKKAVMKI